EASLKVCFIAAFVEKPSLKVLHYSGVFGKSAAKGLAL
ncbi:hypothetical protein Gotur_004030, partial [Gossypium turneri]